MQLCEYLENQKDRARERDMERIRKIGREREIWRTLCLRRRQVKSREE